MVAGRRGGSRRTSGLAGKLSETTYLGDLVQGDAGLASPAGKGPEFQQSEAFAGGYVVLCC